MNPPPPPPPPPPSKKIFDLNTLPRQIFFKEYFSILSKKNGFLTFFAHLFFLFHKDIYAPQKIYIRQTKSNKQNKRYIDISMMKAHRHKKNCIRVNLNMLYSNKWF